jgi:uncharacterized protein (TIGR02145 family)
LLCLGLTGLQGQAIKDIDGNVYNTINIGKQVWIVENLKTTKYNDGTTIPLVSDIIEWGRLTTPGYCLYNYNIDESIYKNTYGVMYNWYSVNTGKLCPKGWHVPTDADWTTLTTYLGGENVAGDKLKETGTVHWKGSKTIATNESGFTALPGGLRDDYGAFDFLEVQGHWWSSTEYDKGNSWRRGVSSLYSDVFRRANPKAYGYSVRCLKDN